MIPFNRPSVEGAELEHVQRAVASGHSSAKGPYSDRVSALLRDALGAEDVLMTTSCTAALELAAMLLDLGPGDTVIVPSFTFVTTAAAFARYNVELRFADIARDTLGLDPESVRSLIDPTVRAVVPVHYAGIGCDMDGLREVVADYDVAIIEDNAHGLFGSLGDELLGSIGRMSTLSFHETKNFTCGEGGAIVLNDERDVERAHILYDKGTNRRAFTKGEVDKYTWVDSGSSFGLSDLLAAYLFGQLEIADRILQKRRAAYERYCELLKGHDGELGFELMRIPPGRSQAYHMFYVLLPTRETRDAVLAELKTRGVYATFHYVPLHSSPMGERLALRPFDCSVTDDVSARLIRLPFFTSIEKHDIDYVAETFLEVLRSTT
ncbi:MAG: dTDP-4-amino-4,6-dideoxygalactose transaminase [Actinomycetota bacterium]|jgi:dTDP-4-amino-4,6-dideoxygalactose transaminase|nr:dTDP-4-amino-4,6-dideoxygalactose transaminase [Actinomycetota bacterium]